VKGNNSRVNLYIYSRLFSQPEFYLNMNQNTTTNPLLKNLVSDFESVISNGSEGYFDEKEYHSLISYYEKASMYEKALEVLSLALQQFEFRSEFYLAKAKLLLNIGQLEQSYKYLDKAENVAPFEVEIKILRAKVLAEDDRNVEALNLLDTIKSGCLSADLAEICISESYIFEKMKQFDLMFSSLSEALEIDASNTEALDRIWLSAELSRGYLKSITLHKRILDKDPYNYLAWYNLGHAYSSIGEYEEAIISLEYSFIINGDFKNGYLDCADLCFQLKKYEKSLEYYKDAQELFGPDTELNLFIAECHLKLEQTKEAKSNLFSALKVDPYNEDLYYNLAECYSKEKSWYKAINAYHKAISIDDNREEYYLGLALAYAAIDNDEKAIINFKKSTMTGMEQPEYWLAFCSYLIRKGMISDALMILNESEDFTYSAGLLYCRAACSFIENNTVEGLTILEEALLEDFFQLDILYTINPEFKINTQIQAIIRYYASELNITTTEV